MPLRYELDFTHICLLLSEKRVRNLADQIENPKISIDYKALQFRSIRRKLLARLGQNQHV